MKRAIQTLATGLLALGLILSAQHYSQPKVEFKELERITIKMEEPEEELSEPLIFVEVASKAVVIEPEIVAVVDAVTIEPEPKMSREDIELIALLTMAEAEGECEEGKRLVIDTVLNRVDSDEFPNTVKNVIYQKNQFTSMWNGRVDRCYVMEEICQLVEEELESRTNSEVVFFHAGKYGKYGTPLFSVENHYFSGI